MVRVLQSVDDYEPQPVNLGSVQLTDDLQDLQEAIAENAHEVWAAARMKEGCSEKEYDRQMAFDTIKLVKKLGFDLIKVKG